MLTYIAIQIKCLIYLSFQNLWNLWLLNNKLKNICTNTMQKYEWQKLITINIHIRQKQSQEHWRLVIYLLAVFAWLCSPCSWLNSPWHTHNRHTVWTCRHSSTLIPPSFSLSRFLFHLINWRREAAYKKYKMLSISQLRPKYTKFQNFTLSCKVVTVTKNHYQKNWLTLAGLLNMFLGLFTGWEHDALWGISISKRNTNPLSSHCTQHTYS